MKRGGWLHADGQWWVWGLRCVMWAMCAQVDTEIFDILAKETGRSREELHTWAGSENEFKRVRAGQLVHARIKRLAIATCKAAIGSCCTSH